MAFEDWYHADRNDPEGRSSSEAGMQTGMMIGSLFGPAGTGIGAVVGGAIGGIFGSNGARKRARREATNSSYAFAADLFAYAGETRTQINEEYEQNLSLMTARAAATGSTMSETFAIGKGKLVETRDTELASLEEEVQSFREGPNYEWLRNDLERVSGIQRLTRGSQKNDEQVTTYRIGGWDSRSSAGHAAYSQAQKDKMVSLTIHQNDSTIRPDFEEYAAMIKPSLEMYEKKVFGGEEGLEEYNAYMDARIDKANEWWAKEKVVAAAKEKVRLAQQEQQDQRGNR